MKKIYVYNTKRETIDELCIDESYFNKYEELMKEMYKNSAHDNNYSVKKVFDYYEFKKIMNELGKRIRED